MIDKILAYYQAESSQGGLLIGASGILLLLLAVVALKFANPLSFLKGLTIPLIIAGIFFGVAGAASGYYTKKSITEKLNRYQHDRQTFFKQEVTKVEKIHKSWFGVRLGWTILALSGLGMLFLVKRNFFLGIALGILIFGLLGHVVEAFSFLRNERYRDVIIEAAKKEASIQVEKNNGETLSEPAQSPGGNGEVRKQHFKGIKIGITGKISDSSTWQKDNTFVSATAIDSTQFLTKTVEAFNDRLGDTSLWRGTVTFPGPFSDSKSVANQKPAQELKEKQRNRCNVKCLFNR